MSVQIESIARPADGAPAGALVLFHGRGADERDLVPLADALDPQRRLLVVFPRGPLELPPGGAHWYQVMRIGYPDPGTFLPTAAAAAEWLDGVLEREDIGYDRTVLGGFSQGAVMSWTLGLGSGRPTPAGILALSGFIPTVDDYPLDLERHGLEVAIGHGTMDPVIGVEWGRDARDRMTAAGAHVLYRESPMAHTIDPRFLADLVPWVAARLP